MHITRRTLLAAAAVGLSAPARAVDANLIAAAKREGALNWYTTLVVGQIVRPMVAAFEARYPEIKVATVAASWQDLVLRCSNEARAGSVRADLVDGGVTFYPLNAAGLIDRYVPEAVAGFPADYKEPSGVWNANIIQIATAAVNTDLVSEAETPKGYEDLLHPRWKGRIAWTDSEAATGPPGFIGNVLMTMGEERGMAYLRRLAGQQIANIPAIQRVVLDQAISGQYPLVLCVFNYHAEISAAQGAPIRWLKLAPVLTLGSLALIKNGPHPNAARLFTEFNLSDEGQKIYAAAGYIPASPSVPATTPTLKPAEGGYEGRVISQDLFVSQQAKWIEIYQTLFR